MHPIKALLFLAGGVGAAGATAAVVTGFDPLSLFRAPEIVSTAPTEIEQPAAGTSDTVEDTVEPVTGGSNAAASDAAPIVAPTFGLVRVEPDGSLVVAGSAASQSHVELVTGARTLGETDADRGGDFAIVLDTPLAPGDYQLVLRSTAQDGTVATSLETAVVSVPDTDDGQVLALVEQAGEPSRLITKPASEPEAEEEAKTVESSTAEPHAEPEADEKPAVAEDTDSASSEAVAAVEEPETTGTDEPVEVASAPEQPAEVATEPKVSLTPRVFVEAVEIEGRQVFVAGTATPGMRVRVYANDILLGDSMVNEGGRFLVETERDLPVGDYIIRADLLNRTGSDVLARAAVPFERQAGVKVAAVAPAETNEPADAAAEPSEDKQPAAASTDAQQVASTNPVSDETAASAQAVAQPSEPEGSEAVVSPKLEPAHGAVIIRRGDTLWQISHRVYGRGVRYTTIYTANEHQIEDPHLIWPGQIFHVPYKVHDGQEPDFSQIEAPPKTDKPVSATQ